MLTVNQLHFAYAAPVLQDVNLTVQPGEQCFILGPSGCGKSTLLRCIAGLLPDEGCIEWNGPLGAAHERPIGMLFQEPALFPHKNVWQNVAFGLKYKGVPKAEWRSTAETWLRIVGLEAHAEKKTDELSGGQRQRVSLARTLSAEPELVLLDEPLSALDRDLRDRLGADIRTILKERNIAAIWVTHDEEEAKRLSDTIHRMQAGALQPF